MEYLPIFADINRRPCLVVGGGEVAWRKTQMLLKAGANVHLVAKSVSPKYKPQLPINKWYYWLIHLPLSC